MSHRLFDKWRLVVLLAGAGLALLQLPGTAQAGDLDRLSHQQLDYYLTIELNEIFSRHAVDPNGDYSDSQLKAEILWAVSDAADSATSHAAHQAIPLAALEAEMEEAGTSLEDVIDEALAQADEIASGLHWRMLASSESSGLTIGPLAGPGIDHNVRAVVAVNQFKNVAVYKVESVKK